MERRTFLGTLTAASLGLALGGKLARAENVAHASAAVERSGFPRTRQSCWYMQRGQTDRAGAT